MQCPVSREMAAETRKYLQTKNIIKIIDTGGSNSSLDHRNLRAYTSSNFCAADQNNWLRSTKLFSRWSVSVEQSAAGNQDITDTRTVL